MIGTSLVKRTVSLSSGVVVMLGELFPHIIDFGRIVFESISQGESEVLNTVEFVGRKQFTGVS